jgi:predicted Fe-Mo cluster-binding NifX family protein
MEAQMPKTRIAAVSTDGQYVNEHFGKATRFLIYDVDDQVVWVENRPTESLSEDDPGHRFDADKFSRIASLLEDCSKVYISRIGQTPAAKLKELGIEPVVYQGAIGDIK